MFVRVRVRVWVLLTSKLSFPPLASTYVVRSDVFWTVTWSLPLPRQHSSSCGAGVIGHHKRFVHKIMSRLAVPWARLRIYLLASLLDEIL